MFQSPDLNFTKYPCSTIIICMHVHIHSTLIYDAHQSYLLYVLLYVHFRRPTVLLEHELSLKQFYPKSSKGTKEGLSLLSSGLSGAYENFDPQESFEKQIAKGLPADEQFLVSFLSGESCLRGVNESASQQLSYNILMR